jgi:hypothetical protein
VPVLKGLVWNLVSPYRGLVFYAPATLLFVFGFAAFGRMHKRQLLLICAIVVYVLMLYSGWWAWHGGWCWGPRFLVPVMPLLLLPGLVAIRSGERWLLPIAAVLGIAGFAVQLSGVLINYTAPYDYWIKIGRLDWAETNIHTFSPIITHFKSVLATPPAHYDLWLIQAARVSARLTAAAGLGLAAILVLAVLMVRRARPGSRSLSP